MGDIHLCNSGKGSIINKYNFPSFCRPGGAVLLALQDMVLPGGRPHELLRHGRPEEGAGVPGQQAGGAASPATTAATTVCCGRDIERRLDIHSNIISA